ALFISVGVVGILFALVWWRCYREPHQDSRLSDSEREHILRGGGLASAQQQQNAFSWPLVRQLLAKRQVIGASVGQFAGN
ncbi:MFS transporter, partial [Klebsiella pneumoniae]|nr:MFS transporter [Klebsiella pneumoniae]